MGSVAGRTGLNLTFGGAGVVAVLYNDFEHGNTVKTVSRLKPQSYAVAHFPNPDQVDAMKGIPLSHLLCSNDNAMPWKVQVGFIKAFGEVGVEIVQT